MARPARCIGGEVAVQKKKSTQKSGKAAKTKIVAVAVVLVVAILAFVVVNNAILSWG